MSIIPLSQFLPDVSGLAYGCMGLGGEWNAVDVTQKDVQLANNAIDAALDIEINLFDHADIYSQGKAELVFGKVLKSRPALREHMYIQSKCGIRFADSDGPKRYDFSKEWISSSVDGILTRLGIEYIDILFLHRPDPLAEMEEVAVAIEQLQHAGKIRHVGVSNMHGHQLVYLQHHLKTKIIANQIEISLKALDWVDEGVVTGNPDSQSINFASGTLEYCQLNGIQLQSWGCMSQGLFSGRDVSSEANNIQETAMLIQEMSQSQRISREAVVLSWLMRHPAKVQPVIGTTDPERIHRCGEYRKMKMSRGQWYKLYEAARGEELP